MRLAIVSADAAEIAMLRRLLRNDPEHEVVWVASEADSAIGSYKQQPLDLVLLSLGEPASNGVALVARIMREAPCPILLVARSIETHAAAIFEAIGAGALDVIGITPKDADTPEAADALLAKLAVLRNLAPGSHFKRREHAPRHTHSPPSSLVVLGASAGGPTALAAVLSELPAEFSAPIIIVQHIDSQFVQGMAAWLGDQCKLSVRLACHSDPLEAGVVYVAGGSDHLVLLDRDTLGYRAEPLDHPHRPSIDELFLSVARFWNANAIGVLLTGMGQDGAAGLRTLRDAGALTITQDRDSSVVYGIPKAAARLNAAVEILPLNQIAGRIREAVRSHSTGR